MKKSLKQIAAFATAVMMLTGCGAKFSQEEVSTGTESDDSLIVVGVSQIGSESVWRTANTASIQNIFTKENGYFLTFDNARQKQENQIKAIRSFISQQVDYIVFSPIMEDGWETVLQEAKDAGIPVVLMDRQMNISDDSLYMAWVGSNFYEEGVKAGEYLEGYLEDQGRSEEEIRIIVLQGTLGSSSETGRTRGFDSIAEKHDNWKILAKVDAEYTTAKGHEEMEKLMAKYNDFDVLVSQNDDMTFGALEVIKEAGKTTGPSGEIAVISFDAVRSALEMVRDGVINVDVECNPKQGEAIDAVIKRLEAGESLEKQQYVSENVFTIDNVEEFIDSRTY